MPYHFDDDFEDDDVRDANDQEDDEETDADADDESDDSDDDDDLDDDFPLGEGSADTSALVWCPYCGEESEISLDPGSGSMQSYVEDCPVCCRPWDVRVTYRGDGSASVELRAEDES